MTITVFLVSLLAAMALGVPITLSLLFCGAALHNRWVTPVFDRGAQCGQIARGTTS